MNQEKENASTPTHKEESKSALPQNSNVSFWKKVIRLKNNEIFNKCITYLFVAVGVTLLIYGGGNLIYLSDKVFTLGIIPNIDNLESFYNSLGISTLGFFIISLLSTTRAVTNGIISAYKEWKSKEKAKTKIHHYLTRILKISLLLGGTIILIISAVLIFTKKDAFRIYNENFKAFNLNSKELFTGLGLSLVGAGCWIAGSSLPNL